MKLGSREVPCGCAERKEIMFTEGKPDIALVLILGVPLAVLLITITIKGANK